MAHQSCPASSPVGLCISLSVTGCGQGPEGHDLGWGQLPSACHLSSWGSCWRVWAEGCLLTILSVWIDEGHPRAQPCPLQSTPHCWDPLAHIHTRSSSSMNLGIFLPRGNLGKEMKWKELRSPSPRLTWSPASIIHGCCSIPQSCLTLCDPMDRSTPGFPVLHPLLEFAQTHVHWVGDAI